jgi:hypothetical protein
MHTQDWWPILRALVEHDSGGLIVVLLDQGSLQINGDNLTSPEVTMLAQVFGLMNQQYSENLSGYLLKSHAGKRDRIRKGGAAESKMLPYWLTTAGIGAPIEPHPLYAPIVEQIFREYVAGRGKGEIAARLQRDGTPCPQRVGSKIRAQFWRHTLIGRTLANRAVVGEFQPMKEIKTRITQKTGIRGALKRKRTTDGAPVQGYYPRVISDDLFAQAAQLRTSKRAHAGARIGGHGEIRHLLAKLATCPICGSAVRRANKGEASAAKYVCSRAVALSVGSKQRLERGVPTCQRVYVPVADVERALIDNAERLCADAPSLDAALSAQLSALGDQLSDADTECANLGEDLAGMVARGERVAAAFNKMAVDLEAKRDALAARYAAVESKVAAASTNVLKARIAHLGSALTFYREAGEGFSAEALTDANAALYECFSRVVIDYPRGELVCHWRHGPPPSVIRYAVDVYPDLDVK